MIQVLRDCTPTTHASLGPTSVILLFAIVCILVTVALAMWIVTLRKENIDLTKRLKQYEVMSGVASSGSNLPADIILYDCNQRSSNQPTTSPTLQVLVDNADNRFSLQSTTSTLSADSKCAQRAPGVFTVVPKLSGESIECSDQASFIKTKTGYV